MTTRDYDTEPAPLTRADTTVDPVSPDEATITRVTDTGDDALCSAAPGPAQRYRSQVESMEELRKRLARSKVAVPNSLEDGIAKHAVHAPAAARRSNDPRPGVYVETDPDSAVADAASGSRNAAKPPAHEDRVGRVAPTVVVRSRTRSWAPVALAVGAVMALAGGAFAARSWWIAAGRRDATIQFQAPVSARSELTVSPPAQGVPPPAVSEEAPPPRELIPAGHGSRRAAPAVSGAPAPARVHGQQVSGRDAVPVREPVRAREEPRAAPAIPSSTAAPEPDVSDVFKPYVP